MLGPKSDMAQLTIVAVFLACVLHSLIRFDQIVTWLRTNRNEMWNALGRPMGYFSGVLEGRYISGIAAREHLAFTLMWKTPSPMREFQEVHHLVRQMRTTGWLAIGCVIVMECCF